MNNKTISAAKTTKIRQCIKQDFFGANSKMQNWGPFTVPSLALL